jgi:hypothetical protein
MVRRWMCGGLRSGGAASDCRVRRPRARATFAGKEWAKMPCFRALQRDAASPAVEREPVEFCALAPVAADCLASSVRATSIRG